MEQQMIHEVVILEDLLPPTCVTPSTNNKIFINRNYYSVVENYAEKIEGKL